MANVLVIGDLHLPAVHPEYLDFCKSIKKKYKTTQTVFIGDIVDLHAISFHKKHPESDAAILEYEKAMDDLKMWRKSFPVAKVCIGNHDERIHRLAADSGIPSMYLREYEEIYKTPRWDWQQSFLIDDIFYYHGTGINNQYPSYNAAKSRSCSVVSGHTHSVASINWMSGPTHKIFGMNVGCGVDITHKGMAYGSAFLRKPILSAGVVIDGHPYLELM